MGDTDFKVAGTRNSITALQVYFKTKSNFLSFFFSSGWYKKYGRITIKYRSRSSSSSPRWFPTIHSFFFLLTILDEIDARCRILDIMAKTINEPQKTKKANTPELETLTIPSHKRGRFLGIGGSNLKKILAQTGILMRLLLDMI